MLTENYIDAILVDEDLADQIWKAWNTGEIDNDAACIAWTLIADSSYDQHGDSRES